MSARMYFERQEGLLCGKHAANNVVGSALFQVRAARKKEYSRSRRRGARSARRFFASTPGSHVCVSACCKVSDFDAVEKELAERAGEQPKLGGDYAADVVLTAASQRIDFAAEGCTMDARDTSSPAEG